MAFLTAFSTCLFHDRSELSVIDSEVLSMFDCLKCSAMDVVCLFVLLLYVPSQQLWSWWDGQFTSPIFFLGKLEQAVTQYFVHIFSLVTDNNPS